VLPDIPVQPVAPVNPVGPSIPSKFTLKIAAFVKSPLIPLILFTESSPLYVL
jgi:hypothetical protein